LKPTTSNTTALITPNDWMASDSLGTDRARPLIRGFPILLVCGQVDQPGCSGPKAAGIEVERREVLLEVDVKPLATSLLGVRSRVSSATDFPS
jgi:hypothetical protein